MDGVARDRGETVPGLGCVAAPVFVHGHAVAAVSLAFPLGIASDAGLVAPLREATKAIGQVLAVRAPFVRAPDV